MNIWILDGEAMERLKRDLELRVSYSKGRDREVAVVVQEMFNQIKDRAVKVKECYPPFDSELIKEGT